MKLVNYKCSVCGEELEELFDAKELIPDKLDHSCPQCDSVGVLDLWNFKNNSQVQKFEGQW